MDKCLKFKVSTNQKINAVDLESVKKPFGVIFSIDYFYIRAPPTPIWIFTINLIGGKHEKNKIKKWVLLV